MLGNLTLLQREKLVKFLVYYFKASKKTRGILRDNFPRNVQTFLFSRRLSQGTKETEKEIYRVEKITWTKEVREKNPPRTSPTEAAGKSRGHAFET